MRLIASTERDAVETAVRVLRQGGVIVFPTETSYGIGCDPRNLSALGRIYRIKGRDTSKALPLVACSSDQVKKYFDFPRSAQDLTAQYWPGPLTVLLEPRDMGLRRSLPVFKDGLAAVRVSSHSFVQALTCAFDFPITATSANSSSHEPAFSMSVVQAFLRDKDLSCRPDLLVDGGDLPKSEPSTIVKVTLQDGLEVIRQGTVHLS